MTSSPGAPATEPAPNRDYVCGRCKTNTGNRTQGHYWAYCKVTRKMRSFHFCCPGDCALDAVAATAAVAEAVDRSTPAAAAEALREIRAATSSAPMNALDQLPSGLTLAALRERAVLFGGNGCEVPAPDLLCLLDALGEAREELASRDAAIASTVDDLHMRLVFNSRDWGADRCDAWLYGAIVGWECDAKDPQHVHDEDCNDAMAELAAQWGWNEQAVAKLRAQHVALTQGGTA